MTVALIDSTVAIHLFRKNLKAQAWNDALTQRLSLTPITWLEVTRGVPNKAGQVTCKSILGGFDMEYLTPSDMDQAMDWMERFRLSHGVGINDCLIASVSFRLQVPLYTHNVKDMQPLIGALAVTPY